jgi:hypothetical protein
VVGKRNEVEAEPPWAIRCSSIDQSCGAQCAKKA